MSYIADFKVVTAVDEDEQPENAVQEIGGGRADLNPGFLCTYVWLVPILTDDEKKAATSFSISRSILPDCGEDGELLPDLADGAGGRFVYLTARHASANKKISRAILIRTPKAISDASELPGVWAGLTSDIRKGRGGDFLYLAWAYYSDKTFQSDEREAGDLPYIKSLTVVDGEYTSQKPVDAVKELGGGNPDINRYGNLTRRYLWLVPVRTKVRDEAATSFRFSRQYSSDSTPGVQDLARGIGVASRYLFTDKDPNEDRKIIRVILIWSNVELAGPASLGDDEWDGMTSNMNKGYDKGFLYLAWAYDKEEEERFVVPVPETCRTLWKALAATDPLVVRKRLLRLANRE